MNTLIIIVTSIAIVVGLIVVTWSLRCTRRKDNKKVLEVNVSGYHKRNGTLGHIIAMTNGGSHTWSNIQLECMECNTKKGVRNGGQLRLF